MNRKEHFENMVNGLLLEELMKIENIKDEVEGLITAELLDIELKAIKIFETIQKMKFNSDIFRTIREMKQE